MPKQSGFSIVEVVLAGALFIVFSTALVGILLQSLESGRRNTEFIAAIAYAEEGMELARTIRKTGFSEVPLVHEGSVSWNGSDGWNTSDNSGDWFDTYERRITIEYAHRDGNGTLADEGSEDARTLKVTVKVYWDWDAVADQRESVEFSEYFAYWEEPLL